MRQIIARLDGENRGRINRLVNLRSAAIGYAREASMQLELIQEQIRKQNLDGWLFFDHHRRDPLAYRVLGLDAEGTATRRWHYLIPANGEPQGLVHAIESGVLKGLPGSLQIYSSWQAQRDGLTRLLAGCRRVAMQYS